jgi:hypothetical protein
VFFAQVTEKVLIDSLFSGKIDPAVSAALWHEGVAAFTQYTICGILIQYLFLAFLFLSRECCLGGIPYVASNPVFFGSFIFWRLFFCFLFVLFFVFVFHIFV